MATYFYTSKLSKRPSKVKTCNFEVVTRNALDRYKKGEFVDLLIKNSRIFTQFKNSRIDFKHLGHMMSRSTYSTVKKIMATLSTVSIIWFRIIM